MRMWMVNPKILCRKHLLGEHVEHHMFIGTLAEGKAIAGYLANNLMEPAMLYARHDQLAAEMVSRGYKHKSPLRVIELALPDEQTEVKVDSEASLLDLVNRCPECADRYAQLRYEGE